MSRKSFMGTKLSKKGPKVINQIQPDNLRVIIQRTFKYNKLRLHPSDIYSMFDLQEFLNETIPGLPREGDPALHLLNLERIRQSPVKSTFGYVYGDVRLPENTDTVRMCSQNFYIDKDWTVWLIDPKSGRIFQPIESNDVQLVIV